MSEVKFYICKHCGNVAIKLEDKGVPLVCCGEPMPEMVPGTVDAAQEKHVPLVTVDGNVVTAQVGEVEHPMLEEHSIRFIALQTQKGLQVKYLNPGEAPLASFIVTEADSPVAVYEWCNLHGVWKTQI